MKVPETVLDVTFHQLQTYHTDPMMDITVPDHGAYVVEGNSYRFVSQYDGAKDVINRLLEDIKTPDLYQALATSANIDWAKLQAQDENLARQLEEADEPKPELLSRASLIFDPSIRSCYLVLFGSAVRKAVVRPDHHVVLNSDEWAHVAFSNRELGPEPDNHYPEENPFSKYSGVENPEEQRSCLGHVATALLLADGLSQPQTIPWRRHITTFHARV